MLIYRDQCSSVDPRQFLFQLQERVRSLPVSGETHDGVVATVIDLGAIDAALADAVHPQADGLHPLTTTLRHASHAAGHLLCHSWEWNGDGVRRWRMQLAAAIEQVLAMPLPHRVELRVAEGYAQYGLFPETYLEAARRFSRSVHPCRVVTIGIRSIGTSLAGIVAGALEETGASVVSYTIRPRGHPFERHVVLSPELQDALRAEGRAHFVVVDEGPGISGSSFDATAEALNRVGVPNARIGFFPSRPTDGQDLRSESARRRWGKQEKFATAFEEVWLDGGRLTRCGGAPLVDISAGRWREKVIANPSRYPAVHPQHERRKLLADSDLLTFAGLGRYAQGKLERARELAERGFTVMPKSLVHGFLRREFVPGEPLCVHRGDSMPLELMASYLAHLRRCHPGEASRPADLREMMKTNVSEALGAWGRRTLQNRLKTWGTQQDQQPIALDGRMLPQEWLRTSDGHLKVDVVDHHDDHFFPGCQDIAWDVAATCIEFDLSRDERRELVSRYRGGSGDHGIHRRLHYFATAYLAYRVGYAVMAESTLGQLPDGRRFGAQTRRYRHALKIELGRSQGSGWDV